MGTEKGQAPHRSWPFFVMGSPQSLALWRWAQRAHRDRALWALRVWGLLGGGDGARAVVALPLALGDDEADEGEGAAGEVGGSQRLI